MSGFRVTIEHPGGATTIPEIDPAQAGGTQSLTEKAASQAGPSNTHQKVDVNAAGAKKATGVRSTDDMRALYKAKYGKGKKGKSMKPPKDDSAVDGKPEPDADDMAPVTKKGAAY